MYRRITKLAGLFIATSISSQGWAMNLTLEGEYVVPAPREELKNDARFPIENYRVSVKKDVPEPSTMEFDIPIDLVGEAKSVRLTEVKGAHEGLKIFDGDQAVTTCVSNWKNLQCVVNFKNLNINPSAVNDHLERTYRGQQLRNKKELAERFGNEPIGFFSLKDPSTKEEGKDCREIGGELYCF